MQFAINMLKALQSIRNPFLDTLFSLITRLGEETVVFGVICILFWCINKNYAYKLGLTFFGSGIAVQGAKVSFCIERPFVIDPSLKPVDSAVTKATGYSFPSGHTQGGTSLFGFLAFNLKRVWAKILCVSAFLLVGFSRMYLGVHTVYDVAVSLVLALVCAYLVTKFADVVLNEKNSFKLMIVIGGASTVLCIYSFLMAKLGPCDISQINDCFKTGGAGLAFAIGYYLEKNYIRFDPKNATVPFQILKFAIGVGVALAIKSGLKLIAPGNLMLDLIRYFLTVFWVVAAYPFIFNKLLGKIKGAQKS